MIDLREKGLPTEIKVGTSFFTIKTDFREWLKFEEKLKSKETEFNEDNWYLDTPADYTFNVEYNQSKQTDQEEDNSQEAEVEEE